MADFDFVPVGGRAPAGMDGAVGRRIRLGMMVRARERGRSGCRQDELDGQRCDDSVHGSHPSFNWLEPPGRKESEAKPMAPCDVRRLRQKPLVLVGSLRSPAL